MQGIALLTLCRLAAFLTDSRGYTAAYALGTALAVFSQICVMLLIRKLRLPGVLRFLPAAVSVLWAGALCLRLHRLLTVIHTPAPLLTLCLLLVTLCLILRKPFAATARAASVILIASAAALVLLPVSGIGTAEPVYLRLRDSIPDSFLHAWSISGDLLLMLPVLRLAKSPETAKRIVTGWGIGCGAVIPGIILLGTMQNGRLRGFGGSPFFMLLARTPLSDAVRTDGFWLLLAVALTVLSCSALLRIRFAEAAYHPTERR